jgi:hypothetical protein
MGWMDYALLALVAFILFLAIRHSVRKKAAGRSCGCGCAGCAASQSCPSVMYQK